MVKGVHKTIVEISNTGNHYFDRAILFVRPSQIGQQGEHLDRKGQEYVWGLRIKPSMFSNSLFANLAKFGAGALAGAGITALLFLCL